MLVWPVEDCVSQIFLLLVPECSQVLTLSNWQCVLGVNGGDFIILIKPGKKVFVFAFWPHMAVLRVHSWRCSKDSLPC